VQPRLFAVRGSVCGLVAWGFCRSVEVSAVRRALPALKLRGALPALILGAQRPVRGVSLFFSLYVSLTLTSWL
jgi:hypothetical protein